MRKNSQLVENQLKSFFWTLYRFFRIISRKLDLVLKFGWFCHQKKFHPLFFGPCLSCLLGGEGRVRWNAWCERRRGLCVVHEVSMCRGKIGDRGVCACVHCWVLCVSCWPGCVFPSLLLVVFCFVSRNALSEVLICARWSKPARVFWRKCQTCMYEGVCARRAHSSCFLVVM